jgi:hypothetical protein
MFTVGKDRKRLPAGPDELLGTTEAGKLWAGILLTIAALAVLVWAAIKMGSA